MSFTYHLRGEVTFTSDVDLTEDSDAADELKAALRALVGDEDPIVVTSDNNESVVVD